MELQTDDIDDPYSYRARQGFIGIEMWPGNDTGVYLQGHLVIPNPWGDIVTNGTTTTTTDDTIDKDGGDGEACGETPCQVGAQIWQWGAGIAELTTEGGGWFKWGKTPFGPIDWALTEEFFPCGNGVVLKLFDILIPEDKLIDLLSSFGVGYRVAEKLGDFTLDCSMKGRIKMHCTVIECPRKRGKSPTCGLDCECVGNGGSDKKTIC